CFGERLRYPLNTARVFFFIECAPHGCHGRSAGLSSAARTSTLNRAEADCVAFGNTPLTAVSFLAYFLEKIIFLLLRKIQVPIEYRLSLAIHLFTLSLEIAAGIAVAW